MILALDEGANLTPDKEQKVNHDASFFQSQNFRI